MAEGGGAAWKKDAAWLMGQRPRSGSAGMLAPAAWALQASRRLVVAVLVQQLCHCRHQVQS